MFPESQLVPISALQHFAFCPRQCALIHLEWAWADNRLTAEGTQLHDKVHSSDEQLRGNILTVRDVALRCLNLGLVGKADIVEFHREPGDPGPPANPAPPSDCPTVRPSDLVALPRHPGPWRPMPVEYKHGQPKTGNCDTIQVCAQALCLEEMLNVRIGGGALFYGRTRRRLDVYFDSALRAETVQMTNNVHELFISGITPAPVYAARCKQCSLIDVCMPRTTRGRSADAWVSRMIASALSGPDAVTSGDDDSSAKDSP
jgi:CRISPR-associated exonuclease Cas4